MRPVTEDEWSVDLGGIHVVFGDGALGHLGELAAELLPRDCRRILLVTDPGLRAAGHVERAATALRDAGNEVFVFDGVGENPTTEHVAAGVEAARRHGIALLVGLGGGSALDCCKGVNFLLTNGGRMEDYWGADKASKPMLPAIGVPTTAGTGSEAQRFALISRPETHRKMACGDKKARFRTVVLDPRLIASVPREVAAVTGMDALSHAVESYVTARRNPMSRLFAREAWRKLEANFERYLADPADHLARCEMLLGSHLAGAAIETSMLGAAHSCANPLTANYGLAHGVAVGLMLPHVVRFNGAAEADSSFARLRRDLYDGLTAPELLAARIEELGAVAGLPRRLADCGVERRRLPRLAAEAAEEWTARFNPRPVTAKDLRELYEAAF